MAVDQVMPTRVLLLKNYPSASPSDQLMVASFTHHIQTSVPDARLDICCVANEETIPDLHDYRLVILSGGKVNLLADDKPSWALEVLDMVRKLAKDQTGPKLLGICWGHQAIHYALGGRLAWVEDGPRIGVQDIPLTQAGKHHFGVEILKMHKYHVRYIAELAQDFTSLARHNDISLSESGRILTFQGHPELTYEISSALSKGADAYQPISTSQTSAGHVPLLHDISTPHDGSQIWSFIMTWALAEA